jgi:Ca-activated chloride channel homolog
MTGWGDPPLDALAPKLQIGEEGERRTHAVTRPCATRGFAALVMAVLASGSVAAGDLAVAAGASAASGAGSVFPSTAASAPGAVASGYVEVEKVRAVLLPTKVEDRRGRVVAGLTAGDFELMEDSIPQKIDSVSVEADAPVSIAFMLDVSGSMRISGKLEAAKEAIRYFLDDLRPQDRFALIAFADDQVSWITEFTSDRQVFLERLAVQTGYGQTALHDAIAVAPGLVQAGTDGRKAIILITDGVDNASRMTLDQAVEAARRASVPIYAVGFSSLPRDLLTKKEELGTNFSVLSRFSDETGASLFAVHDPDELKEAVVRIDEEMRHQYLISYVPSRAVWNGAYRRIQLVTRKGRYQVRTRTGYYATP